MYKKLDFKILKIEDWNDLKLIEGNLKSQNGVKSFSLSPAKDSAEITMEIEDKDISPTQIFDLVKIVGDFKIEGEEKYVEAAKIPETPVTAESAAVPGLRLNAQPAKSSKLFFLAGVLTSFLVISLMMNVYLGSLLTKSGKNAFASSDSPALIPDQGNDAAQLAPSPSGQAAAPIQEFNITKSDHVRGDFNAPITLVEYSDFECPFCGRHYPTLNKILADYKGKVRLVYKHFPLVTIHANAQKAAEASECANEQGKFWEYHDKLFENQSAGFSLDNFKKWAKDLKLNSAKFESCLDTGKYADKVNSESQDGQTRGVQGTPATFVNGQVVSGAVPYENFKQIIDQILNDN